MGMFDYLKSSYPLPEPFMGINQTKDIEDCIGGTLGEYWIDPSGILWCPSFTGVADFTTIDESDPEWSDKLPFLNYKWVPTGEHGKMQPKEITKYVEIYPEQWEGKWEDWPRLRLHFRCGKLQDYEDVTGR